jgi:putative tricarboxylic transport membrane protein
MNIPLIGLFTRMLTVPLWFLVPAIAAVSAVGVYAVHSTTFDLLLMVGLGVFGYILRKMHFPMSPLILGFVLGEMLEQNLRRALSISNGNFDILWSSAIAQCLLVLAVAVLVLPPLLRKLRKHRRITGEATEVE